MIYQDEIADEDAGMSDPAAKNTTADLAYLRMEWARINRKGGVRPPRI